MINTGPQNLGSTYLRVDYSRVDQYTRPEPPHLTFGQKLGRFFGKAMGILGPIGAAVSAIALPGIGLPIAAGIYGLTKFSQDSLAKAQYKDQLRMQASQQQANQPMSLPGLFEQNNQPGIQATNFMMPGAIQTGVQGALVNRTAAAEAAVQDFKK